MNATQAAFAEEHRAFKIAAGSWGAGAFGGLVAAVLSTIGLAGGWPSTMAAISVISIGASLFCWGGATAASYRQLIAHQEGGGEVSRDLGGTMSVEFLAGFAGIVLGIVALLGISATVLVAVAVIVYGSAFLLGSRATAKLSSLWASSRYTQEQTREVARKAANVWIGGLVLVGLAAYVLEILALLNKNATKLNLVALLSLGVAVLLCGAAFGSRSMIAARA